MTKGAPTAANRSRVICSLNYDLVKGLARPRIEPDQAEYVFQWRTNSSYGRAQTLLNGSNTVVSILLILGSPKQRHEEKVRHLVPSFPTFQCTDGTVHEHAVFAVFVVLTTTTDVSGDSSGIIVDVEAEVRDKD